MAGHVTELAYDLCYKVWKIDSSTSSPCPNSIHVRSLASKTMLRQC